MILELVEFNSPKGWSREQVAEEARNVIPKWRANKELLRKHFLLELNGKTGAGVYIWPSVEAAQRAHDEEWRQSVIKRTGSAPTIRYFDLFLLIDNEKGAATEFPAARRKLRRAGLNAAADGDAHDRTLLALGRLHADRRGGQTARNAMQRELTATLGTVGATHVRFLFGFPFALMFLAGVMLATGSACRSRRPCSGPGCSPARWRRSPPPRRCCGDGRALVRRRHRLYQDRAGAGGAVRPDLSRRHGDAADRRRDPDRDRRRRW